MVPSSENILESVKKILMEEGINTNEKNDDPEYLLNEFVWPGLSNSKDTLSTLYSFKVRSRSGLIGKFKSKLQEKLVNVTINVVEKQSIKQQKFNELTVRSIGLLIEENKKLRESIEHIKKTS